MSNTESTYEKVRLILEKSQVKAHTRTSKSGAVSNVKTYNDKRTKKVTPLQIEALDKTHDIHDEYELIEFYANQIRRDIKKDKKALPKNKNAQLRLSNYDKHKKELASLYSQAGKIYDQMGSREEQNNLSQSEYTKRHKKTYKEMKSIKDKFLKIVDSYYSGNTH